MQTDGNSTLYSSLSPEFYDDSLNSLNPITRAYHRGRYDCIRRWAAEAASNVAKKQKSETEHSSKFQIQILDVGSGSSAWNCTGLGAISSSAFVTALDFNEKMLEYSKRAGRIGAYAVVDISKTPWPIVDDQFDLVILSEVLEHVADPQLLIREAARTLVPGGCLMVTVPLDVPFSVWRILFGVECFVFGDILGNEYYRNRCGHVQHFGYDSLMAQLEAAGLSIVRTEKSLMNLRMLAKKPDL